MRATVLGHWLGGGVALQFAYQFPEQLERLVLVSSGGLGREVSILLRAGDTAGVRVSCVPVISGRARAQRRTTASLRALGGSGGASGRTPGRGRGSARGSGPWAT